MAALLRGRSVDSCMDFSATAVTSGGNHLHESAASCPWGRAVQQRVQWLPADAGVQKNPHCAGACSRAEGAELMLSREKLVLLLWHECSL